MTIQGAFTMAPDQDSEPTTMEAKLLYLERLEHGSSNVPPPQLDLQCQWKITNCVGVRISSAHVPTAPPPFTTKDATTGQLIQDLTTILAKEPFCIAEPGWSRWFVDVLLSIMIPKADKSLQAAPSYRRNRGGFDGGRYHREKQV